MTFPLLSVLFLSLIVGQIILLALMYWFGASLFKVANVTFRRALATALLVELANLICNALWLWLTSRFESTAAGRLAGISAALSFAFSIIVSVGIIKRGLRAGFGQALLIWLATIVLAVGTSYGMAVSVKAALVEAFVVPSNSMATTILGTHTLTVCGNCGFKFPVGSSGDRLPGFADCPNCRSNVTIDPSADVSSGDRILVDKTRSPQRWDLAIFQSRTSPGSVFVHRIVGMPGETIELNGGHVFADSKLLRRDVFEAADLWRTINDTQWRATTRESDQADPRWEQEPDSHWLPIGNAWTCDAMKTDGGLLSFKGAIFEHLPYNGDRPQDSVSFHTGDLRVDCYVESFAGEGNVTFHWEFDGQKSSAQISANGQVELNAEKSAKGSLRQKLGSRQLITFAVRDGRIYVCEDQNPIVATDIGSDQLAGQKSRPASRSCRLAISVDRCAMTISRIVTWEQISFRSAEEMGQDKIGGIKPVPFRKLADDEFLLLGDNVERSNDSRFVGPIKREAIVGIARWIYWPPSRWHEFQ